MEKTVARQYESVVPGLSLSIKGLEHNIIFSAGAPGPDRRGYLSTTDTKIQKLVEAHARFKDGTIKKVPSKEELEAIKKKNDQKVACDNLKEHFKIVGVPDFSAMKIDQLTEIANHIGVDIEGKKGKKKLKEELAEEITDALK